MRPLCLVLLLCGLVACDSQPAAPAPEASPFAGAWSLPDAAIPVESPGVRFADVEFYELTVGDDGRLAARQKQSVTACSGTGLCAPLCQSRELELGGRVEGERLVFDRASMTRTGEPETIGTTRLTAELAGPDSLRVQLTVTSSDAACRFDGEAVLGRTAP